LEEGSPEHFFSAPNPAENDEAEAEAAADVAGQEPVQEPIDEIIFHLGNRAKDIALVCAQGLEVDNDNEPAPEKVPEETGGCDRSGLVGAHGQKWGWDGIDERKLRCPSNPEPGFSKSFGQDLFGNFYAVISYELTDRCVPQKNWKL